MSLLPVIERVLYEKPHHPERWARRKQVWTYYEGWRIRWLCFEVEWYRDRDVTMIEYDRPHPNHYI